MIIRKFIVTTAVLALSNASTLFGVDANHKINSNHAHAVDDEDFDDEEEYEIIEEDQVDPTSTLAIPLDNSNVYDEEMLRRLEEYKSERAKKQ